MLRSGLAPRRFAQCGVLAVPSPWSRRLSRCSAPTTRAPGASFILTLPEAVWVLSLGIYLTVKGFKPSHVLDDDGRQTGVDGPLIPVLAAPELLAAP